MLFFFNPIFIIFSTFVIYLSFIVFLFFFFRRFLYKYINIIMITNLIFICFIQVQLIIMWVLFDPFLIVSVYNNNFQHFFSLNFAGYNICFGVDSFSIFFFLLTGFIFLLCIFICFYLNSTVFFQLVFFLLLLLLQICLFFIFSVCDIFFFYIAFESSLIPMFFIIGFWGSRTRKIKAAFYLFFYTMFTALLTLFIILYFFVQFGTVYYFDILFYTFSFFEEKLLWLCFFLTFATKIPIMPFHIWLPEAHVEAPTIGSVILASILLKLGGFGILRFLIPYFPSANFFFLPLVYTLTICSIIYASFTTIRQFDLKRIIAYSSIAHMNFVILGIFCINNTGLSGSFYLMIGHGIVSSALFFLVGVLYERHHTRLIRYYGGLIQLMPLYGGFFFFFLLGNIGFPGTSNFLGELLILFGLFEQNFICLFFSFFGVILSAVYSIWLFNRLFFGPLKISFGFYFIDLTLKESVLFSYFFFTMFFLGLYGSFLLNPLAISLNILFFINY